MPDDPRARTAEAFSDPKVGDRFHEMYSYWVYVIGIDGEQITTFESGHLPVRHPAAGKYRTYPSHEAFRTHFAYDTIPGYWVTLSCRGYDVTGWLRLANLTVRIEQISRACPDGGLVRESWQWTCECHGRVSVPWPERPTELNAQAEHDLLFGLVRS